MAKAKVRHVFSDAPQRSASLSRSNKKLFEVTKSNCFGRDPEWLGREDIVAIQNNCKSCDN
jgi:hypothetical protein